MTGRSLHQVLPSALAATGRTEWRNALDLPAADSYVVLLVDGLGQELLTRHPEEAPYLSSLLDASPPARCGVPSTTATSLTSVGTGLLPGRHGVVGYTCRIPGTDRLLDALRWNDHVDPFTWQPHPTVFEQARELGIPARVVSQKSFARSGLTLAGQRGAVYVGADTSGQKVQAVAEASREPGSLTYVYVSELDYTGHRSGCESAAWRYQLGIVDGFAQLLREEMAPGSALVVTADHGMVDVGDDGRVDVDDEPALADGLQVLAGEARLRHLYCRSGAVDDVAHAWRSRLGEDAVVLTRDEAVAADWFGEVDTLVRPRLGDVLVACTGPVAVMSSERFPQEFALVGMHGSVTEAETVVPMVVDAGAGGTRGARG